VSSHPTSSAPPLTRRSAAARLAAISAGRRRSEEAAAPPSRTPATAIALGLVLLAALLVIVLDAASGKSPLLPPSPHIATWLGGVGETLSFHIFLICLLVFSAGYAGLIFLARRVTPRVAIALVVLLNVIVFLGPILISTDIFSYLAYVRMYVLHAVNPYIHGPRAISSDHVYKFVGTDWVKATSAYGPLYTVISTPAAPLGLVGGVWLLKTEALISSGVACWLTWRCAEQRGFDPVSALLVVGANPLWVIYALGGGHNDLMMIAFIMAAVTFALSEKELRSGATIIAGAFVKATAVAVVPFMVLGRRRPREIAGMLIGLAACLVLGLVLFGVHGIEILTILRKDSSYVSSDGFPTVFMHLLGKPGVFPVDHIILAAALAIILIYLLWRTWRGLEWIAASGWALLAIGVTSPWLLGWYLLWALPLGTISRDRRLIVAVLVVQALYIFHQIAPLFSPVSS
jgi:alpha-1,6-mannosyltransferase